MDLPVTLVVLLAAALHAGWNALVKGGTDKLLDTALLAGTAGLISALALPFLPLPAPAAWPWLAAAGPIHVAYFLLVAASYRAGDMALTYPLMRGTAPLLVAAVAGPVAGEGLGAVGWLGVLLVCGGIPLLALSRGRPGGARRGPAVAFALGTAATIAAYTLVDGLGARASGHPVSYTAWMFVLTVVPLLAVVARRRGTASVVTHLRLRPLPAMGGGTISMAAYALVLWAMTQAPIAMVAALRETSVLFGAALASLALREALGPTRVAGAAAVAAGAAALHLG